MTYFDQNKNEKYIPYVIEPSLGADRVALAFLCDCLLYTSRAFSVSQVYLRKVSRNYCL